MKKTRFLALFLCLVLALGFLPPKARAAGSIRFEAEELDAPGPIWTYTRIRVSVDTSTMTAQASFRRYKDETDWDYIQENTPKLDADCHTICHNTYGQCYAKAEPVGNKGNAFRLTNLVWQGDPYIFDGGEVFSIYVNATELTFESGSVTVKPSSRLEHPKSFCALDSWSPGVRFKLTDDDVEYINYEPVKPEKKEYTMGRDNFGFDNEWGSFFDRPTRAEATGIYAAGTRWGSYGSLLDDSSIKAMISGRSFSQTADIISRLNRRWQGSCYGMSITSGLLFEEKISPRQFAVGSDPYHFTEPANNEELARTLTYYQVIMNYDFLGYEKRHSADLPGSRSTALSIARSLKEAPEHPVVVGFSFSEDDGAQRVWHAHAVLAFKVEDASGGYKYDVSVYDPNEPKEARHIYLTEDGDASFAPYNTPYFRNADKARDLYDATLSYPELPPDVAMVTTDSGAEVETDGKTATVRNDQITGNLDVTAEKLVGGDETVIYVPVTIGQGFSVRLLGGTSASVQTADTFVLITGGAEEVILNADGSVTAKTNGTEGSLAVASDKTGGSLFGTTVETKAGEVTITPTNNGANVTTNGGTADITVSGGDNSVTFENVDTSKGVDIRNNGNSSTLTSDGQEIAKGTANANGGTTEAAQPAQPAADKQQISDDATQKASGNSAQIVDKRKSGGDTTEQFRSRRGNKKYSTWAEQELALADALGIIPEALFNKLTGNITRREFAQLVYNTVKAATGMSDADMAQYAKKPGNTFDSQYSDPAVAFAYGVGIVSGYEDGSFRPDNTITREQAAKMLVVMAELLGKLTSESGAKNFNDAPNNWAQTYINKISSVTSPYSGARVMGGDDKGNFSPTGTFTTEQAVATMLRMFESVVDEKSGYSGGVIQTTAPATTPTTPTQTGGVSVRADNDMTGYSPKDWSWVAEGEGYGLDHFTSGKYVRADGRAVLYIESSDSPDGFSYQLFVMASGARQSNYEAYNDFYPDSSYASAYRSETYATDYGNWLFFDCSSDGGSIEVESDWNDEMYLKYDAPDGTYYLVREKK